MLLAHLVADPLRAAIERYGYGAVAAGVLLENLGVPVPGDAMLLAAAASAQQGILRLPLVVLVGALAAMAGDNLGFELGRKVGRPQLGRHFPRLFTPARLARADAFFQRRGAAAVALARFVPGVRVVAAVAAGTSTLSRRTFVAANALGALAWSCWTGFLGYTGMSLGKRLLPWLHHAHRTIWVAVALSVVVALVAALIRKRPRP